MKKNNLHSNVFFRHQGGYSLKKLWFHLMLLDFERGCGLSQSEEDLLIVRAKAQPDSESDPEEHNHNPFHDSENSYSKEDPRFIVDLREKIKEEIRLELNELEAKYFPKDDPGARKDREKLKAFFEEANYHIEKYFNGLCFGGGLRDKEKDEEKAIAMIRAVIYKYFPKDDPDASKDPEKIKKCSEEANYIVERYNNGDLRFIVDPREKVEEEIHALIYKYFPKDDSGTSKDPEKIKKFYEEANYIVESYNNGDPRFIVDLREKIKEEIRLELNELEAKYFPKDDPGARKDREKIDKYLKEAFRIVERYPKGPSYGDDPQEDDSDYGSDTDGPDYGSDTDGPDCGSDPNGPDCGSDPDGHFYESDPEDYLQKKRNPGGDYLQIDRYPEDTGFKIERDPQKIDRYIEEPYLDYGSNPQKDDPSYGGDPQKDDPSYGGDPQEDDSDSGSDPQEDDSDSGSDPNPRKNYTHKYKHLWLMCDECYTLNYRRFLKEKLYICEGCGFHLKMNSSERLKLLIDPDTWDPMNEKMASLDPIEFHSEEDPYIDRINSYQKKTGLTEAIQTGLGQLNGIPIAIGVMEFGFMGGSMGSVVGEKITRLVEYATNQSLPLIIVCASGGARMQEGSLSLMQMAKISSSLYDFQTNKKLFYVSILTSPTTGGVTASFGMLGDVIFSEPDAYIAFAGKRVIELTLNKEVPEGSQETEYLFEKGLFDLVVPRKNLKSILNKLFGSHGFFPLNQNNSSITEH
nr:acetyl-CoA carboxylase beta subunit [Lonicera ferdinandi]